MYSIEMFHKEMIHIPGGTKDGSTQRAETALTFVESIVEWRE